MIWYNDLIRIKFSQLIEFLIIGIGNGGFPPNVGSPNFENGIRRSSFPIPPSRQETSVSGFDEVSDETVSEVSESNWSVPPIRCDETGSTDFPLYIQLGPAAGHRGNQGNNCSKVLKNVFQRMFER